MMHVKLLGLEIFMFLLSINFTVAQTLPNVQKISLKAPVKVSVDGSPKEWSFPLEAYNNATNFYYTIANNDSKLFVVLQIKDQLTAKKAMLGGVTLTLNKSGLRNDNASFTMTYPQLKPSIKYEISQAIGYKINRQKDSLDHFHASDSIKSILNNLLVENALNVKVTGELFKQDTSLSIYNKEGIRSAAMFDDKRVLTIEFSVPLSIIGVPKPYSSKLAYNVMINGNLSTPPTVKSNSGINSKIGRPTIVGTGYGGPIPPSKADALILNYPTDFWGEYKLGN